MRRAKTRCVLALVMAASVVGCARNDVADEGATRHEPVGWTRGRSWLPGRVPGRADHEEVADGVGQSYAWGSWEVEVEPGEVVGFPGELFIVDVHMRPVGDDVEPLDVEHGDWMWLALAQERGRVPTVGGTIRTHTVLPLEGSTAWLRVLGGEKLPGVGLRILRGEPIGSVTPSAARDDATFPAGLVGKTDGRNVRIVYALGRHDHRDCQQVVEPLGDFELERAAEDTYLLLGKVRETSSETCAAGGPFNPRVEAALTLPSGGELRVTIVSERDHPQDKASPNFGAYALILKVY